MANTIEARVKQKKDTLPNWEANPMILLDGEQAFVVGSTGQPINFKIGDGTKRFSDLPFWIQYDQAAFVPVSGLALPTPTQEVAYTILGEGTYTHASGGFTVPAGHWGVANWDGSAWSFSDMGLLPASENKIIKWQAGTYTLGDQRLHNGQVWSVNVPSTTQEPGTGSDWVGEIDKVNGSSVVKEFDSNGQLFDKDTNVLPNYYVNSAGDLIFNNTFDYARVDLSNKGINTRLTISGVQQYISGSGGIHKYVAFYQGTTKISAAGWIDMDDPITVTIPTNADNAIFTVTTPQTVPGQLDTLMVNYGEVALPVAPVQQVVTAIDGSPIKNANRDSYLKTETYTRSEVDTLITEVEGLIPEPLVINKGFIPSKNIADPSRILNGLVSTTSGAGTQSNATWRMIWVPCNGNEDFSISGWGGVSSGIGFFSGPYPVSAINNTNIISSGTTGSQGITRVGDTVQFTTPAGCTWWVITIKNATETSSVYANLMIARGSEILPYEPFGDIELVEGIDGESIIASYIKVGSEYIDTNEIALKSDITPVNPSGSFRYDYDDSKVLTLIYNTNTITTLLGRDLGYTRNNVFEFQNFNIAGVTQAQGDDAAPVHAMNYTLGANHGGRSWLVTIPSHGLTNLDIGTLFTQSGTFVLARIVGSSQLQFISENIGTAESPAWNSLVVGVISRGGVDYNITAIDTATQNQQIYPSIKNHTRRLFVDGVEVIDISSGSAEKVEVHESYEIKTVESIYDNLVARAGTSGDPTFDGTGFMRVDNIYRFTQGMTCLVLCKYTQLLDTAFADIMATQSAPIGPVSEVEYYLPNSNPLNASVDLRKPKVIAWGGTIPGTAVNVGTSPDPANPPHRVIQYRGNVGYMTGYLKDRGVGKNITDFTNVMFELRNNTGKIYPHPVEDVKVGDPLLAGNIFSIGMYRVYTDLSKTRVGDRLSVFTVPTEDSLMVYVDYSGSMLDNIKVEGFDLSGKNIEIVESKNTVLKSDMYVDGFDVEATYIEGETCYMIVKI